MTAKKTLDREPLTLPAFQSKLPPEFLDGLDERGRYLYEQIDLMAQANAWLGAWAIAQDEKVEAIRVQTTETNGKVRVAREDIVELKNAIAAERERTEPLVKTHRIALKLVRSRFFWAGVAIMTLVVIPWAATVVPPPAVIARGLISLLIGL